MYVLADTEEERGNYSTKTAAQFASGEVGYLLANGGESNWYTPAGAKYPVYDAATLHNHAHITCDDNLKLTGPRPSHPLHLYAHEGEEFTVEHSAGHNCPIFINNELVSTNGTYTGKVQAGNYLVSMTGHVEIGDEFEYNGLRYVVLTLPDGDTPGSLATKPGTKENDNVTRGNPDLSGDLVIPSAIDYVGKNFIVTQIGAYSLAGNVTSISLPETLDIIGDEGIHGLNGLTHISFPASVTSLGNNTYPSHPELTSIEFAKDSKLTVIPFSAFQSTGLVSVVLPSGVTTLENFVFFRCADLESVVLPSTVEHFGFLPFGDNPKLTTIVYLSDDPLTGTEVDFNDYSTPTFYALASAKEKYQSVDPWKRFTDTVWCGITLDMTDILLKPGSSEALEATLTLPPTMSQSVIEWTSSDPAVATVNDDGLVTGKTDGTATITATHGDFSADCEVTVHGVTTAIDEIFTDGTVQLDVYNLQGICVKRNATAGDLLDMPSGLYIVRGRKLYLPPR